MYECVINMFLSNVYDLCGMIILFFGYSYRRHGCAGLIQVVIYIYLTDHVFPSMPSKCRNIFVLIHMHICFDNPIL